MQTDAAGWVVYAVDPLDQGWASKGTALSVTHGPVVDTIMLPYSNFENLRGRYPVTRHALQIVCLCFSSMEIQM